MPNKTITFKTDILPYTSEGYNIGDATHKWKVNGYVVAAAAAKSVDTSISAGSTSANLPTSGAVASFVEGKGYVVGPNISATSLTLSGFSHTILACTSDRASYAGASDETPRYIPGKWRLSSGQEPQNGNVYMFQLPEASTAAGIYLSVNGTADANYHPIILNTTAMMTTHFSAGTTLMVVYEADSTGSIYALTPTTNDKVNVTGIFRVVNFYDANTNTLLRTYASTSANELPLVGSATSTSMAVPTHTSSYKDSYGGIPSVVANRPVVKLSTGEVKIPAGMYIGAASSKLGKATLYNTTNSNTTVVQSGTPSANVTVTMPTSTGTLALDSTVATQASVSSAGVMTFKNSSNTQLFTVQLPLYNGGVS